MNNTFRWLGSPATITCEPRQVRKEAAVTSDACAGMQLGQHSIVLVKVIVRHCQ